MATPEAVIAPAPGQFPALLCRSAQHGATIALEEARLARASRSGRIARLFNRSIQGFERAERGFDRARSRVWSSWLHYPIAPHKLSIVLPEAPLDSAPESVRAARPFDPPRQGSWRRRYQRAVYARVIREFDRVSFGGRRRDRTAHDPGSI